MPPVWRSLQTAPSPPWGQNLVQVTAFSLMTRSCFLPLHALPRYVICTHNVLRCATYFVLCTKRWWRGWGWVLLLILTVVAATKVATTVVPTTVVPTTVVAIMSNVVWTYTAIITCTGLVPFLCTFRLTQAACQSWCSSINSLWSKSMTTLMFLHLLTLPCRSTRRLQFAYIVASFVIPKVQKQIHFVDCHAVLVDIEKTVRDTTTLIVQKESGKLLHPTRDVLEICFESEHVLVRIFAAIHRHNAPQNEIFQKRWALKFWKIFYTKKVEVFNSINDHCFTVSLLNNHKYALVECVAKSYVQIRLLYIRKNESLKAHGKLIQTKLSKTILFQYQWYRWNC